MGAPHEKRQGYQADANRVANQTNDIVNAQPFHDLATMAFNRLDAEPEPFRDIARPMSFCDKSQHLNLPLSQGVQRTPDGERFTDRLRKTMEIHLQNEIRRAGADGRNTLRAGKGTCDDYERSCWTNGAHYLQGGARINLSNRMVRQNDVGSEALERGGERFGGIDSLHHRHQAGPLQLGRNERCISPAVFEEKNAERFIRRSGDASHSTTSSGMELVGCSLGSGRVTPSNVLSESGRTLELRGKTLGENVRATAPVTDSVHNLQRLAELEMSIPYHRSVGFLSPRTAAIPVSYSSSPPNQHPASSAYSRPLT